MVADVQEKTCVFFSTLPDASCAKHVVFPQYQLVAFAYIVENTDGFLLSMQSAQEVMLGISKVLSYTLMNGMI